MSDKDGLTRRADFSDGYGISSSICAVCVCLVLIEVASAGNRGEIETLGLQRRRISL